MVFAYIDPGAGSLVIQALLAAVLAVPYFFRTRIAATVARMRRSDAANERRPVDD